MTLGLSLQYLAFASYTFALASYALAIYKNSKKIRFYASLAVMLGFVFVVGAVTLLEIALVTDDIRNVYVANYAGANMPLIYKITALWGGQAGSLLFWLFLIAIFAVVELASIERYDVKFGSYIMIAIIANILFFNMMVIEYNPFELLDDQIAPMLIQGVGLNPLLQNIGMIYHPPLLYIGYTVMLIPFSYAFAALITRRLDAFWIDSVRSWILFAWTALTAGVILGGQWAYVELGWGGYWAWDPVENASIFPWFAITAYLHMVLVYKSTRKFAIFTFATAMGVHILSIFGTYLTRSGIVTSVHSFAPSSIGTLFLYYMGALTLVSVALIVYNRNSLSLVDKINFQSKSSLIVYGVVLLFALNFAIIFGTIAPVITGWFGEQRSPALEYYNIVSIPLFMVILLLMSIASVMVTFRRYGKKLLYLAIVASVLSLLVFLVMGYRSLIPSALLFVAFMTMYASAFTLYYYFRSKVKFIRAGSLYGAQIVHFGIGVIAIGIISTSFYSQEFDIIIDADAITNVGETGYSVEPNKVRYFVGPNYEEAALDMSIYKDGQYLTNLLPGIRMYPPDDQQIFREVAIYSHGLSEFYVAFITIVEKVQYRILVIIQPLMALLWIGSGIIMLGGLWLWITSMINNSIRYSRGKKALKTSTKPSKVS